LLFLFESGRAGQPAMRWLRDRWILVPSEGESRNKTWGNAHMLKAPLFNTPGPGWVDEKLVLHKLRVPLDSVARLCRSHALRGDAFFDAPRRFVLRSRSANGGTESVQNACSHAERGNKLCQNLRFFAQQKHASSNRASNTFRGSFSSPQGRGGMDSRLGNRVRLLGPCKIRLRTVSKHTGKGTVHPPWPWADEKLRLTLLSLPSIFVARIDRGGS
jgi:hypothetical protein